MKKLLAFVMSFGLVFSAVAGTSATLVLSGIMPHMLNISVLGVNGNDALDLTTSQSDLVVGQVTATSNAAAGFKVYVKSTNGGALINGNGTDFRYSSKFNGQALALGTIDSLAFTSVAGSKGGDFDFSISYTADSSLEAGTYSDSVVFTIQPN